MGNDENKKKNDIRNEFVNEKKFPFFFLGGFLEKEKRKKKVYNNFDTSTAEKYGPSAKWAR